jgi:hypothetical protein
MVDIKKYNLTEKRNLAEIISLEEQEKKLSGKNASYTKMEPLFDKMRKLNPLRQKDKDEHPGSKYDADPKCRYKRKLPLDAIDGKIITLTENYLPGWTFLQVRTGKFGTNFEYVMFFKGESEFAYKKCNPYLKQNDFEYNNKFIKDNNLSELKTKLGELLADQHKLLELKAEPDVDWPGQGEGPGVNYEYLIIALELENKSRKRKELLTQAAKAKKEYRALQKEARKYK